ncbi:MAG TPA: hypothetical protein VJ970_02395 [Flavobacteriaceae bacterium]|nr:hypothetical protein [Flavobacteriaceae bacterium]
MRNVIIAILLIVLGLIGYGYYLKDSGNTDGEIVIGIGVLITAFVLMPLFIYHRYKNKDLSSFKITNFDQDEAKKKDL